MPAPSRPSRRSTLTGLAAVGAAPILAVTSTKAAAAPGRRKPKTGDPLIGAADDGQIHLMSFNIRYDKEGVDPAGPDYWPTRRPAVVSLLQTEQPTLLGLQEAEFHQLSAIEEALPHHQLFGYGRAGGSAGEYSAISVDRDRFTVLEWDQFWLSDTPDVIGSATWGNTVTRIVTWVRLQDNSTQRQLVHANTHFDHASEPARVQSAHALAELRTAFPDLPFLVTGDFNVDAEASEPYSILMDAYTDTWLTAQKQLTPDYGTFPNYKEPIVGEKRIDWALTTADVLVHRAAINVARPGGVWPSDHTPVQALVELR